MIDNQVINSIKELLHSKERRIVFNSTKNCIFLIMRETTKKNFIFLRCLSHVVRVFEEKNFYFFSSKTHLIRMIQKIK